MLVPGQTFKGQRAPRGSDKDTGGAGMGPHSTLLSLVPDEPHGTLPAHQGGCHLLQEGSSTPREATELEEEGEVTSRKEAPACHEPEAEVSKEQPGEGIPSLEAFEHSLECDRAPSMLGITSVAGKNWMKPGEAAKEDRKEPTPTRGSSQSLQAATEEF